MSERTVEHAAFVVERVYDASPDRVFAAWSDPQAKAQWFRGSQGEFELDFRVGGWERGRGTLPDGREHAFEALYRDIVPDRRIVYTYDMHLDGNRISVSVVTVEFKPVRDGTRLVLTEQGAFLDGREIPARRERGMGSLLDSLGQWLRAADPTAADSAPRTGVTLHDARRRAGRARLHDTASRSPDRRTGHHGAMAIGTSLFLIAVGAILRYAVTAHVSGFDIQTAGGILIIIGGIGLLIGLFLIVRDRSGAPPPPGGMP